LIEEKQHDPIHFCYNSFE